MTEKNKLFICDDEEGIRESYKLILGDQYDLVFSCSGKECLEKLKDAQDAKLVLMDIKMPKQNGLEATREIKRLYPNTKVIIVTGYSSAEIAQEALSAGASDYIVKPFESKEIAKKISAYF